MKIEVQRTGNIIIEGGTTGATTNNEGRFSLEFSEDENSRVIVSYIGY